MSSRMLKQAKFSALHFHERDATLIPSIRIRSYPPASNMSLMLLLVKDLNCVFSRVPSPAYSHAPLMTNLLTLGQYRTLGIEATM